MHYNIFKGSLIIAPPSAFRSPWIRKFKDYSSAMASGWIGNRNMGMTTDKGFVLSDHADWKGLNTAVKETGADNIYVTHGYTEQYAKWLVDQGYDAQVIATEYHGV